MADQPENSTDILEAINRLKKDLHQRIAKQDALLQVHDESIKKMETFMQQQVALNESREALINQINSDLSDIKVSQRTDSLILQKLSRLWLADDTSGLPKPKSHAIGTWPGWKIIVSLFTALGGLVLAYQILVPVLIAINNALLNARVN